jgi:2-polyprenyl-3-methyl-5-hydroxy-6-metoxy-1,4-benzoquinol methylase
MPYEINGSSALVARRIQAAHASGGISNESIYALVERTITDYDIKGTVLDYGAGTGNLTLRLARMNRFTKVHAVDLMDAPHGATAVVWHKQDLNGPVGGYDGHFDLIAATEIIEHLENPRFVLRELFRLCQPGGYVIVTTPNNESIRSLLALVRRGHYVAFGDTSYPAHISALLRKDLVRIFEEAGFEAPIFRYTHRGAVPGVTHLSWQGISLGILRGLRFSDNTLALGRKPVST